MNRFLTGTRLYRRELFQYTAAAAGWLGLTKAAAGFTASQTQPRLSAIDTHVHVWSGDTQKYPLAPGFNRDQMRRPSFTPEELFEYTRPHGVDRIVLIQISFYGFDNSYMVDALRRFPGVFSAVGVVDENGPRPQDEMRRLARQGVRGFRIGLPGNAIDGWTRSDGMRAMWQCAAEENLAMCPLINPQALPAVDRMCSEYPKTPVVIDHFSRIGIDGEQRPEDIDRLCRLSEYPNVHVKLSAYYALGLKQAPYFDLVPMIRRLLAAYGPERLMWGSDSPYQLMGGHTYEDSVELIRHRLEFLTESEKTWLLRRTAEKLFF